MVRMTTPEYKKAFWGKCFRCLTSDHRFAQCREPARCLNCFGSGHFARRCKVPPKLGKKTVVHSCLTFPNPNIRSRLTFPPHSIHMCLVFPELSYAVATSAASSSLTVEKMAIVDCYTAGYPGQCLA
jgi:hypothetical protein